MKKWSRKIAGGRIAGGLQEDYRRIARPSTRPPRAAAALRGQLKANTPRGDTDHAPTGHTEIRYRKITHLSLTFDNFDSETRGLKPLRVLEQLSTRR